MKKTVINAKKIIAATSVTIFSLLAAMTGTYAWFVTRLSTSSSTEGFEIHGSEGYSIANVKLYKFLYDYNEILGEFDYMYPPKGTVEKYTFDTSEGTFGYLDSGNWISVTEMNIYDPVELIIYNDRTIRDMNCNVIYEITLHSPGSENCTLSANALLKTPRPTAEDLKDEVLPNGKTLKKLLLSDYVNFDLYTNDDLDDFEEEDSSAEDYKIYYPSYIEKDTVLDEEDVLYHKISYLSSLIDEDELVDHYHFYSQSGKLEEVPIAQNIPVQFDSHGNLTLYLNVNYAPKQLSQYSKDVYKGDFKVIYDYVFSFSFLEANS